MKDNMKENKKAFTLMEMLVVIIIIGILISIVIPSVSSFLNNRNKKIYDTHKMTVDAIVKVYIDQHKEQLIANNSECYNIDYSLLLKENLKESNIHCEGNIILRKSVYNNKIFNPEYYLKCTDSKGEVIHDDGKMPTGCIEFNGKFNN